MKKKYFHRGHFVYVETKDWIIEFNFESYSMNDKVDFTIKAQENISIIWQLNAKEISFGKFMTYYRKAKKVNPFVPDLFHIGEDF